MKTAIMMATAPFLVVTSAIVGSGASYGEGSRSDKKRGSGGLAWIEWLSLTDGERITGKQKTSASRVLRYCFALMYCHAYGTLLSAHFSSLHFCSGGLTIPIFRVLITQPTTRFFCVEEKKRGCIAIKLKL